MRKVSCTKNFEPSATKEDFLFEKQTRKFYLILSYGQTERQTETQEERQTEIRPAERGRYCVYECQGTTSGWKTTATTDRQTHTQIDIKIERL